MLCIPTKVAAANCHALLPESSHLGDGTSIDFSRVFLTYATQLTTSGAQSWGPNERTKLGWKARAMPAAHPQRNRPRDPVSPERSDVSCTQIRQPLIVALSEPLRGLLCREARIWVWIGD